MVPLDLTRESTYEDPGITEAADRERAFGQHDHVRLYGLDLRERLITAGFGVEEIDPREEFGAGAIERHRLLEVDHLFLCRPVARASA